MVSSNRSGFTLIELLAVILLISLIASAVMVNYTGVTQNAQLELSVGKLELFEQQLRLFTAQHHQTGLMEINLDENRLKRIYHTEEPDGEQLSLGNGSKLVRVLSRTRDLRGNRTRFEYSPQGTTETFAIQINLDSGQSTWLLFAGLTGKVTRFEKNRDVEELFRGLQAEE